MRRFHPANLRAAWWAVRTARRTRRVLAARGLDAALGPPPPPPLPMEAERAVRGALRRWHESCLVNAIVLQAWEAAHGRRRDLVVGITGPDRFSAHAWLQGDPVPAADDPPIDASVLQTSRGKGSTKPPRGIEPERRRRPRRQRPPHVLQRAPAARRARLFAGPIHASLLSGGRRTSTESTVSLWSRRSPCRRGRSMGRAMVAEANPESKGVTHPVPDYRVVEGEPRDCPYSPPRGRILGELRDDGFGYWAAETRRDPARWTLRYTGICDVTLDRERKTITVHRSPEADPALIPVFLEGSVLAHALTAEGLLVLHSSAVEVEGVALAIRWITRGRQVDARRASLRGGRPSGGR